MSCDAEEDVKIMKVTLSEICRILNLSVKPKTFQVDFFCKAVKCISGFLLVCNNNAFNVITLIQSLTFRLLAALASLCCTSYCLMCKRNIGELPLS